MLRFAPSPTGDMHIGDLRVALLNYIVSQQKKEDLIVRIEDTDKEKNIEGCDKDILDTLDLFGIKYTQTIHQSQNYKFHSAMALQLLHEKKAFSCFCSDEWLDKKREEAKKNKQPYFYDDACRNLPAELIIDNTNPFRVRITRPESEITINDKVKGDVSFSADEVDSFVILNQDKTSTSVFAAAVDDMISDVSIIIRDEKHIKNAPKQEHIRKSLAYDKEVVYAHLPSIKNAQNYSIKSLLEQGFLPEAILNYAISLGTTTPKDIFTLEEAIEFFTLESISKSPAEFSIERLKEINNKQLMNLDAKELSRYVGFADSEIGELARVFLEGVSTTKELKAKIDPIFANRNIPDELENSSKTISSAVKTAPFFDNYDEFESYMLKETKLDSEEFRKVFSYLLTANEDSKNIKKVYNYLKNYIGEIIK